MRLFFGSLIFFVVLSFYASSQNHLLDYDQVRAEEACRDGVVSYHLGQYGKALLFFEKALQYKPKMADARLWLAQTLFMNGLEEQALNEWNHVQQSGFRNNIIENWVEVIQARRSLDQELRTFDRYLPLCELSGLSSRQDGRVLFSRPISVRPLANGNLIVAAFGTEEILEMNSNGGLVRRLPAGIEGFRAPFDILPFQERFYVSEFTLDRVSIVNSMGIRTKSFGERGRGEGQFLGPQYLATDGQALYVSDYGNARVSKFDLEGRFLLSFGLPVSGFKGLKNPTGLAASFDRVFVSDKERKAIFAFDTSGNWLATYSEGRLGGPEGLTLLDKGRLLVSDGNKVYFLHLETDVLLPFDPMWNQGSKITSAAFDANNNLVMADFADNKIRVLAEGHTIYSGLVVRPVRVNIKEYPQISVAFVVEDRWGRPITGLDASNFILHESRTRIVDPVLEFQGFKNAATDLALVIDRHPSLALLTDQIEEVVKFFHEVQKEQDGIGVFFADQDPLAKTQKQASFFEIMNVISNYSSLTKTGKFDVAVRLAAASMIPSLKRRTVVYVTGGTLPFSAFKRYSISELASFLRNNGIVFSVVSLTGQPLTQELTFLIEQTGGASYLQMQDLQPFVKDVQQRISGLYSLRYTTITPGELSTRNIPIMVEVQKFKQSGRGEISYFAPR